MEPIDKPLSSRSAEEILNSNYSDNSEGETKPTIIIDEAKRESISSNKLFLNDSVEDTIPNIIEQVPILPMSGKSHLSASSLNSLVRSTSSISLSSSLSVPPKLVSYVGLDGSHAVQVSIYNTLNILNSYSILENKFFH